MVLLKFRPSQKQFLLSEVFSFVYSERISLVYTFDSGNGFDENSELQKPNGRKNSKNSKRIKERFSKL
jgi:hypothetical protein